MCGVKLLDHLHARAAILRHLVDVRAIHQPHTDICVPQAVRCSSVALPIKFQIQFAENFVKELALNLAKHMGGRLAGATCLQPLEWEHCAGHALAIPDAALPAYYDFKNALVSGRVGYDDTFELKLRVHLLPFFGNKLLTEIKLGLVQEYRVHRMTSRRHPKTGEPLKPARSTLHKEIIILRHVLKTAERHGWLESIPNLSPPYKTSGKIVHRAWFSHEEYKQLYEATRERAKNPKNNRHREASARLHDFVLFMANTGLRPDEAKRLQFRDVTNVGFASLSLRDCFIFVQELISGGFEGLADAKQRRSAFAFKLKIPIFGNFLRMRQTFFFG